MRTEPRRSDGERAGGEPDDPGDRPARVAVTGATTALGRRVCERFAAEPGGGGVVALDLPGRASPPGIDACGLDLGRAELVDHLRGATALVHLVEPGGRDRGRRRRAGSVELAHRVLEAAAEAGVAHVVVLSSALAYGARPDNPVPLTEGAPLRPNRGVRVANEAAEVESVVTSWRTAHPTVTVAVLRPTVAVAPGVEGFLAEATRRGAALPAGAVEPPAQFVHLDDVVDAVVHARVAALDGTYNVAPDGWADGETIRALAGGPRIRLPGWAVTAVVRTGWRWGMVATPPELLPYLRHPWVVANDRLRATGWSPTHSTEEAYVAAHPPGPFATLSPQRRQELLLGTAAATLLGIATAVVKLLRRR